MSKVERVVIYTLLAVMLLATFSNRGLIETQDKPGVIEIDPSRVDKPGVGTFTNLTIVDQKGKKRMEIGRILALSPDLDRYGVEVYDEAGNPRAVLTVVKGGAWLALFVDEKGTAGASLIVSKDGPGLGLYDEASNNRASLGVDKEGPGLSLYDEAGKKRAELGSTSLEVTATGTEIKRSPSSLVLFDKEGKVIWKAPLTD